MPAGSPPPSPGSPSPDSGVTQRAASDADGTVLATIDLSTYHPFCLRLPDGTLVPEGTAVDPGECGDGVPWR